MIRLMDYALVALMALAAGDSARAEPNPAN
jgi:hypothetical protein